MRVVVTHMTGSNQGERQLFDGERLTIGRGRDNTTRLGLYDTRASSRHAEIVEERGHYVLRDLGSKNGTYVNGKRVEHCRLGGGEVVAFGYGGPQLHFEFYEELPDERPSLDELHEFPFRARFAWALFIASGAFAVIAFVSLFPGIVLIVIPAGLAAATTFLLGLAVVRVNITVGPEGIEHEGMFRTQRVAWSDVAALETVAKRGRVLSGPLCRVRGWKGTIQFSPSDYKEGYLLARLIAEASGKEWGSAEALGAAGELTTRDLVIRENVPLAPLTTFGIGGPARLFARVGSEASVAEAVAYARERALPLLVLGGGSNLLISDDGFPGLVAHVAIRGTEFRELGDTVEVTAGAGESWDALVAASVARELVGIECLSGIPGLVGATPIQNVGAYGQEVSQTITRVRALDLETGETVELDNAACRFGYRESRFKREDRGRFVVLAVGYALRANTRPTLAYAELSRMFEGGAPASPQAVREAVVEIRRRKSMVVDAADPDSHSAGSFFVNPVVPTEIADRIGDDVPRYPAPSGVKLSAAWLIERAGFARGYRRANAGLSTKHTLAIVNRGGATAADVVDLAREIRDRVFERFGVTLTPEPVFVGIEL